MKEIKKGNVYGRNFGLDIYIFQLSFSYLGLITIRCDPSEKLEVFVKHYINERLQTFKVNGFSLVLSLDGWIENVLRDFQFI